MQHGPGRKAGDFRKNPSVEGARAGGQAIRWLVQPRVQPEDKLRDLPIHRRAGLRALGSLSDVNHSAADAAGMDGLVKPGHDEIIK